MAKYAVGKNDNTPLTKTTQETIIYCDSLQQAEKWIEDQQSIDPLGVANGEYYIDGPIEEEDNN